MRDRVEGPAFDSLVALYQGPALAVPHVVPNRIRGGSACDAQALPPPGL